MTSAAFAKNRRVISHSRTPLMPAALSCYEAADERRIGMPAGRRDRQPSLHQVAVQRSTGQWWQRDLARLAAFPDDVSQ